MLTNKYTFEIMLALTKENAMKYQELKRYIKRKKVKDCEVANALHITRSAFSYKMSGKRAFTLEDVKAIQEFFNMSDSEVVFYFVK